MVTPVPKEIIPKIVAAIAAPGLNEPPVIIESKILIYGIKNNIPGIIFANCHHPVCPLS